MEMYALLVLCVFTLVLSGYYGGRYYGRAGWPLWPAAMTTSLALAGLAWQALQEWPGLEPMFFFVMALWLLAGGIGLVFGLVNNITGAPRARAAG